MPMFDEKGIFLRDLAEVHLLFDFISGRASKSLDKLGNIFHSNEPGKTKELLTAQEVVEKICKIRYPPGEEVQANAEQAAFMIVVKDKLNDLAYPARGLTIAFTSMFAGTAMEAETFCEFIASLWCFGAASTKGKTSKASSHIAAIASRTQLVQEDASEAPSEGQRRGQPSASHRRVPADEDLSSFTAVLAFPNLESQARKFRRFYSMMPFWGRLLVVVIAVVSWDCSVASGLMNKITVAERDHAALFASDNKFIPTASECAGDLRLNTRNALICATEKSLQQQENAARQNLRALASRVGPLHPVAVGVSLYTTASPAIFGRKNTAPEYPDDLTLENDFAAVLSAFNTLLTPLLFGWLGTLVGVARSITSKVRDSILAPRDFQIAKVSILLGISAGLTVGLFYTPVEANAALAKSLGGTISVSAATLSFLAGLGSEAFFMFVDRVIGRIFPASEPPSKDAPLKGTP